MIDPTPGHGDGKKAHPESHRSSPPFARSSRKGRKARMFLAAMGLFHGLGSKAQKLGPTLRKIKTTVLCWVIKPNFEEVVIYNSRNEDYYIDSAN
jgi:hypothetical protein